MSEFYNELKLKGRVYRYETKTTSSGKVVCRFGLQFYNGKDKDGKSKYAFFNCKGFEDFGLKEKQEVLIDGYIACEEWSDKQGQKKSSIVAIVKSIDKGFEFEYETKKVPF